MRILISIPTYDRRVDVDIVSGLLHLERAKIDFDLHFPISSLLARNRNLSVHECLTGGYDYLFFWDSDVGLEDGFMKKMLETAYKQGAKIVCGAYKKKDDSGKYVLGMSNEKTYENLMSLKEPREVDAGGTGCMLIHRDVLMSLEDPWFTVVDGQNMFTMPEDFEFCRKAKLKGFKIYADPRFNTRHYGVKAYEHLREM